MTALPKKRFYKQAAFEPREDGYAILLDDRATKTPKKRPFSLPNQALATAIAAEWEAQTEDIHPASMPLTQLAMTAIDYVRDERGGIIDKLVAYGGRDLLCYREDRDSGLMDLQQRHWQPLVDWAAEAHDAIILTTIGLMPQPQPQETLDKYHNHLSEMDVWPLTALQNTVGATGSLIIGLALTAGQIDAHTAHKAAFLEDDYQMQKWGDDGEARKRLDLLLAEIGHTERFLKLIDEQ